MKREDITKLFEGATEEQISALLDINSADIGAAKKKLETERDGLKGQLDTVNEALKKFDGVDVAALQGQIKTLQGDLETEKAQYAQKLADMEFDGILNGAVTAAKGRNAKAIRALLDVDALKASKNQEADVTAALEALKKENAYLFETEQTPPPYAAGTGTAPATAKYSPEINSIRAAAGLKTE